jgi:CubicO group peptidase (beta-lactamase class C family)
MKVIFFIIIIIFYFINSSSIIKDERERKVEELFKQYNLKGSPGVLVSVIENNKFILQRTFGESDLTTGSSLKLNNKFLIASVSKQFTALAIALLEHQRLLNVNDHFQKYLPEFRILGNTTILNLLQHTSGFYFFLYKGYRDYLTLSILSGEGGDFFNIDREYAIELIKKQTNLAFRPNTKWDYSNTGYLLCELIIERISGLSFEEFLKTRIFNPLGMTETSVPSHYFNPIKDLAYSYLVSQRGFTFSPLITKALAGIFFF